MVSPILSYVIISKRQQTKLTYVEKPETITMMSHRMMSYARFPFSQTGFNIVIIVVSVLDIFLSPFSIGWLPVNARLIYLACYALALLFGSLLMVYDANMTGIKLQI